LTEEKPKLEQEEIQKKSVELVGVRKEGHWHAEVKHLKPKVSWQNKKVNINRRCLRINKILGGAP